MMQRILFSCLVASLAFLPAAPARAFDAQQLGSYLSAELQKSHTPGAGFVAFDADGVTFSGFYGTAKHGDERYTIGSLGKSLTALAIMQLTEQNKINLDAPARTYLNGALQNDDVTVRQLLNHTSGFGVNDTSTSITTEGRGSFRYANVNYTLLGKIIENASGEQYDDYLKAHIFTPLGMNRSSTTLDPESNNERVSGHCNYFGIPVAHDDSLSKNEDAEGFSVASGYIVSTPNDMAKYLRMYLSGGGGIIKQESINAMWENGAPTGMGDSRYGFGWSEVYRDGERTMAHDGQTQSYVTAMRLLPGKKMGFIMLTNMNDSLVANELLSSINKGAVNIMLGKTPQTLSGHEYWLQHALYNAAFLAATALAVWPIVRIQAWRKNAKKRSMRRRWAMLGLIHGALPGLLLVLPGLLGLPLGKVRGFAPDVYLVLMVIAGLLFAGGVYKVGLTLKERRRAR